MAPRGLARWIEGADGSCPDLRTCVCTPAPEADDQDDNGNVNVTIATMALTRDFKQTIAARARREPRFREALFTEAINAYLAGDTAEGKAMLRDLVNATVGFEGLALEIQKPSKSLHRMLAPRGNPSTENFFSIVSALQKKTRVKLRVTAA